MTGFYPDRQSRAKKTGSKRYGSGTSLRPFVSKGTYNITSDVSRIFEEIEDRLRTPVGTRFMKPEYGSQINDLLMEPNDYILRDELEDALSSIFETLDKVIVSEMGIDIEKDIAHIRVLFKVKETGEEAVFDTKLERDVEGGK